MKKDLRQRLGDFVLGKGFYIVLFLCVATIGISGYYLFKRASTPPQPQLEPVTGVPSITLPEKEEDPSPQTAQDASSPASRPVRETSPTPAAEQGGGRSPDGEKSEGQDSSRTPQANQSQQEDKPKAPAVFTWPVKGQILHGYSLEVLAYDETMGDWRTHSGLDIAAQAGSRVLCVSDGTVQAVYQDDLMGSTVVVDHGDGLRSTYCNLAPSPTVTAGEKVETGTVLGAVGETAMAESSLDCHLHLELSQDDMPVDPVNYLPKMY